MKRIARCFLLVALSANAGCQGLSGKEKRSAAQEHWRQMRARVKLQLARQQYDGAQFEAAIDNAGEAISLDPRSAEPYVLAARCHVELNRQARAMEVIDAADHAGVRSAELSYARGVLHELRGDYPAAYHAFEEARRIEPTSVEYVVASIECLASLDRMTEAWALLEESNSQLSDDGTIHALRTHLRSLGIREAENALSVSSSRQAMEGSRVLAEEVGRRLAQEGRCREALAVLDPLMKANQDREPTGSVLRAVAACHLASNNPAAATAVLSEFAQANPDDTLAQLLVAKAALAGDDITTALRAIDLVQQREPHRPDLWLVRAAVHWRRGNLTAAANDLFDVLRNDPADVEAHCLLGEVYQNQERRDAAREQFLQALAIDPECPWALTAVRKLTSAPIPEVSDEAKAKLTAAPENGAPR